MTNVYVTGLEAYRAGSLLRSRMLTASTNGCEAAVLRTYGMTAGMWQAIQTQDGFKALTLNTIASAAGMIPNAPDGRIVPHGFDLSDGIAVDRGYAPASDFDRCWSQSDRGSPPGT